MEQHPSFWQLQKAPEFSPLQGDMQTNTVIVGGGICGLLCAYFLYKQGVSDLAIIEANEILSGVTAGTTAKITSQHGLIYAKLLQGMGEDAALEYAAANDNAVRLFREIAQKEGIDCDFEDCSAYVYALTDAYLPSVEDEVRAAQKLGIAATFETQTELPFPVKGAVKFPSQSYFHPLKFATAICGILSKAGCKIYTHTKATGAETGIVHTDRGNIRAEHILSCSHYPFIDKHSLLFSKVYQSRSYVAALKGAAPIRDMYIDCAEGGLSFRPQKDENGEDLLLFGAYDHKTGHEDKLLHYDDLLKEAQKLYPGSQAAYQWSAQDCMTHDAIPYIGRYHSAGENIYLATGFNKWGMTSSMVAADRLTTLVRCGNDDTHSVFSLERKDFSLQAGSFLKESMDIAGNFLVHLTMADKQLSGIHNNEGGIVEIDGRRVGIYRDEAGKLHTVRTVCKHMGCAVKWNKDENTWDCTCHGSRYDYHGNVISGPSLLPLDTFEFMED